MSFQWIIDKAETISINRKKIVGQTTARDGTTRAVSRGGQVTTFTVKLPDGISWTELRPYITAAENLDRVGTATINMSSSGLRWINQYLGAPATVPTDIRFRTVSGQPNQIELYDRYFPPYISITTGQKILGAGDFVQLGTNGYVYNVVSDVTYTAGGAYPIVTLHRPLVSTSFSGSLRIAENCSWNVICTSFPDWTLMARDQVAWGGTFTFAENLV